MNRRQGVRDVEDHDTCFVIRQIDVISDLGNCFSAGGRVMRSNYQVRVCSQEKVRALPKDTPVRANEDSLHVAAVELLPVVGI